MIEFCFEPGLSGREIAEALRKLPPGLAGDCPVVAWDGGQTSRAARIIFASKALLRAFGARDLEQLSERLFAGDEPGAKRLAAFAESLAVDGVPSVEKLRFSLCGEMRSVTFLCCRASCENGSSLCIAAALDLSDPGEAVAETGRPVETGALPVPPGPRYASPVRFLWRTDAEDRIVEVTPPFGHAIGHRAAAAIIGRTWADAAQSLDADHGRRLAEAMARRESWSGVEIPWPIDGSAATALIRFGAAPNFGRDRSFAGYRGFGVIYLPADQIEELRALHERAPRDAEQTIVRLDERRAIRSAEAGKAAASRTDQRSDPRAKRGGSSLDEQKAFDEVAFALGAKLANAMAGGAPRGQGDSGSAVETNRATPDEDLRRYREEIRDLNAILDTVADGVLVLDAEGRIATLNRSAEALFGYDMSEVAGEPFTRLIAPESRARAAEYFEGLRSNGVASLLNDGREVKGLAKQGGAIPLFMTLGRISPGATSDEDAPRAADVRFCALLRDMTHWKKIEKDLDQARREAERASALKSDFLAKISHEIRTPLNAIMGFAEVIMEERFGSIGNPRYRDYLKDIHSSGALVMSLVNDLLDLSKIEAGKMELDFAPVDANRIVSECVSIMQPQASRARVVMRLSLAASLPSLLADERSLRQIVLNLLSNAVKFNQPGGQVIVATALSDSGDVLLRIRDTGVGMSEADVEIALEPFRQLAASKPLGGTGLGLPLTKALVEANRALFSIKSKRHEGTLVEVAFPRARLSAK